MTVPDPRRRLETLATQPRRARILVALIDGRSLPVSVVAAEAGVSPRAAGAELAALRETGVVTVVRSGRHRYHRLAPEHVAAVRRALARLGPMEPIRSLQVSTPAASLRSARTCYDHLAGRLGVRVTRALVDAGALAPTGAGGDRGPLALGPAACTVFPALGVPRGRLTRGPGEGGRPVLRSCMDWSEQRPHLAGRLGADLLAAFFAAGWLVRTPQPRTVQLTASGRDALRAFVGVAIE